MNLSTFQPFNLSTFQPFNLSTFQPFNLSTFRKILLICICFYTHESNAQALSISLAPSNYNGYNVSCFGGRDGAIVLTVSGGLKPYTFTWSNSSTTKDISNVAAGYYHIYVQDRNLDGIEAVLTLTEPEQMSLDFLVSTYPNGYNVSCYNYFNGSILNLPQGGVPPYTFTWEEGATTQDRFNLGSGGYYLNVVDANQCYLSPEQYYLSEPERSDWTMFGNSGSNPINQFIGTTDNKDLVFKTNNIERLRLNASGVLKLNGLAGNGDKFLIANNSGELVAAPCDPWMECGNIISASNYIGSTNNVDVQFKVNATNFSDPLLTLKTSRKISIKEFENSPFGILYTDNFGDIYKVDHTGDPNTFLNGIGSFTSLPVSATIWQQNATALFSNNSTLNLGWGTSSPTSIFEIFHNTNSGTANGISITNSNSSNKNSEIRFNHFLNNQHNLLWAMVTDLTHNGQDNFFIYDQDVNPQHTGATRFLIDAAGNIGVGTESPLEKLHVEGSILIIGEDKGLIIDEGSNRRIGIMKYTTKEAGIWRVPNQKFEIGRVNNTRINFGYNGFANNQIISSTQHNLRGGESLTVTISTITATGISEITAKRRIYLENFRAEFGSYVHIYKATYDQCLSYDGLRIIQPFNGSNFNQYEDQETDKLITINFRNSYGIMISPNPANESLEVQLSGFQENALIKMLTLEGKEIVRFRTTDFKVKICTAELSNGLYFLQATDEKSQTSTKFIVTH